MGSAVNCQECMVLLIGVINEAQLMNGDLNMVCSSTVTGLGDEAESDCKADYGNLEQCRFKLISGPGRRRSTVSLGTGGSKFITRKYGLSNLSGSLGGQMDKPALTWSGYTSRITTNILMARNISYLLNGGDERRGYGPLAQVPPLDGRTWYLHDKFNGKNAPFNRDPTPDKWSIQNADKTCYEAWGKRVVQCDG
ncbi:hypothetical protein TNCV_3832081 [Trichonephila clavipes]|nr:hypothetical protein TNCV_3832081 [Trichonephila clavipes]